MHDLPESLAMVEQLSEDTRYRSSYEPHTVRVALIFRLCNSSAIISLQHLYPKNITTRVHQP